MEEQKTEIVEKRLSRGVIRRRSRVVAEEPQAAAPAVAAPAPAAPVVAKPERAAPVQPEIKSAPVVAEEPQVKEPIASPAVSQEAAPVVSAPAVVAAPAVPAAPKKHKHVLDDKAKLIAQELALKNLSKKETKTAHAEAQTVAEEKPFVPTEKIFVKKDPAKEVPKVEPKKEVLSFKDRIRGTIDLNQFKAKKVEETAAARTAAGLPPLPATAIEEESEAKAKKDKGKVTRKVKDIGGDLDIAGEGVMTNLSQLARISALDRVFRPSTPQGAQKRKKMLTKKGLKQTTLTTKKASKRVVEIEKSITVANLAQELGVKASQIIKQLMDLGVMATMNHEIDKDTAAIIATEHQYEVKDVAFKEDHVIKAATSTEDETANFPSRPPVVTIMGHVDHGKTSLLDAIRTTNVTQGEAGGITQHIGAYTVTLPQGKITFIDTPGHEAFTSMRLRGAQATDIVVLVVAADDGVMPQTIESLEHARAANVPIVVAVNKIDKPQANADVVKRQLSEKGLLAEDWGGETIFNHVSAVTKQGIPELLESILLQAEVLELKAAVDTKAKGAVLESKLDRAKGPLCSILVQSGTLKVGDFLVAGCAAGKVRAMYDWQGKTVDTATPSTAVEVLGLESVPSAGDVFNAVDSDQDARRLADHRLEEKRREQQKAPSAVTLEDMFSRMKAGEISEFNMILKADVQGSLEAITDAVKKIGNEEVKSRIVHGAVGGINESDVMLAMTSKAAIIGFNVRPETNAIHLAKENGIEIKLYKIIYDLCNEVKLAMQGMLKPDIKEDYLGRAEVRQAFEVSKLGTIAGSMVVDGVITRTAKLRLLRDNVVIYEGSVISLKRFKDDAREVKSGFECGIGIEGYKDIKAGDVIEAFNIIEVQKTL